MIHKKPYHFIGIGGIGMSGLARILLEKGEKVVGSDQSLSLLTETLVEQGACIFQGHKSSQVPEEAVVVYSSGIGEENPEYQESVRRGLRIIHRSHLLQELMEDKKQLLVTGTHGKTTTSSLLAHVLVEAGIEPSYCIGGVVKGLNAQSRHGEGGWFVAEADESDGSFLSYHPTGAILTNIGLDHLHYWESEQKLVEGFISFYEKIRDKHLCFWCADDIRLTSLDFAGTGYGFSPTAALHIVEEDSGGWSSIFSLHWEGKYYPKIEIPLIGKHNILNAAAVFGLCIKIGIEDAVIRKGFLSFQGVGRRAEKKGAKKEIDVYDDYGHHPTEIEATLVAMKKAVGDRRLVVVFQPHRFTRVEECFFSFGPALMSGNVLIMTDIYAAGEKGIPGITTEALYANILNKRKDCLYISRERLVDELVELLVPGDVVVTMGASDITRVGPALLELLS